MGSIDKNTGPGAGNSGGGFRTIPVNEVDAVDRPISDKMVSGVGNFFGLYGGEHIAATEFVIGATLVTWGCSALEIIIGLILGNILAVLSFTFFTARIATDTRLTLYSYLKRILGPSAQKVYCLVWGICSIALAASGLCVSATAIRQVVGVPIQRHWYPTSIGFIAIVVILGVVVTLVAANGFDAISKFSSTCVPWMILFFAVAAIVSLPQLAAATGTEIHSAHDIWVVFSSNVGGGPEPYTIFHVACFAWLCNLAWHLGLNDMGLFRFAGNWKYGFITSIGMFVGHFFAWIMVAIMGAAAGAILRMPVSDMDSGLLTYTVVGLMGIMAVVIAGWTTANPTIYRSALALNTMFPKLTQKKVTYIVGILMTALACFPAMTSIGDVVSILGWAVVGVGAICIEEHYVFPKIGWTRYWAMYKGLKANWAAIITWIVSVVFAFTMLSGGFLHRNFIFIPEYILAFVLYFILARAMGARGDYSKEQAQEKQFEQELKDMVDREAEEEIEESKNHKVVNPVIANIMSIAAYVVLAVIAICGIVDFAGGLSINVFKPLAFGLTILYFVLNGIATVIKYKNEAVALH